MEAVTSSQPEPKLGEMKSRQGWLGVGPQGLLPDDFMVSSQRGKRPSRPLPEAHFQVAADTDPSLLLLGSAVGGPCLGHITWGAVAAVGALRVLAVTMGTECSRPVQVITLIHI